MLKFRQGNRALIARFPQGVGKVERFERMRHANVVSPPVRNIDQKIILSNVSNDVNVHSLT